MIGLVVTKPAVQTIAGVTPLPKAKVWAIKLAMLVVYNTHQIGCVGTCLAVTAFLGFGAYTIMGETILGAIALATLALFTSFVTACVFGTLAEPSNHARWRVAHYGFSPVHVPQHVRLKAYELEKVGIDPFIEYLDKDPFLFVITAEGRRVYLLHW